MLSMDIPDPLLGNKLVEKRVELIGKSCVSRRDRNQFRRSILLDSSKENLILPCRCFARSIAKVCAKSRTPL
jgi:hypothetical protein